MRWIRVVRCLAFVALINLSTQFSKEVHAAETRPGVDSGEIVVRVVNAAGTAQADAAVSLFLYDLDSQVFKTMSREEKTDSSGIARHNRLSTDNVYYLVRATTSDGLVGYHDCTLKGKSARQDIDVSVLPAVTALIHVRDESGKTVPGASIRSMKHSGPNGSVWLWFESRNLFSVCGLTSAPSNTDGELLLPKLPVGKIDVSLTHPDFAPTTLSGVLLDKNTSADATMSRGVKLTIHFNIDAKVPPATRLLIDFSHEPHEHPSTFVDQLPGLRPDGTVQLTVAVGKYSELKLTHPEYFVTPDYSLLRGRGLADEAECFELKPGNDHFIFQVHRKVKVHGRVLDEMNGKPVANQFVNGELPSDAEAGPLARFAKKWTTAGYAHTNDRGEFELELAAGPARITFGGRGYISRSGHYPLDVAVDGSTVIPDILVRPMPKVRGVVQDQSGKPLSGAIVRFRGSLLTYACQPTVTDANGQFELSPPWVPIDFKTEEPQPKQTLVVFHPYEQLGAEATVRLDDSTGLDNLELQMVPQKYDWLVTGYPEELTPWVRGIMSPKEKERLATISLVGKPAPELDGAVWLNTDKPKMTLADFRGKYVLLQFWATWCGPCHRDMPSLKLAYRLYKDKGLVVIGVHDNSMSLVAIKDDVSKNELSYPIVVDNPDGRIFASYKEHAMADAYPTYALIGPDGKVLLDDATVAGPKLNTFKTEIIRQHLMAPQAGVGAALRIENGKVLVTSIVPDSAAARADALHRDDQIVAVAEEHGEPVDVTGLALEKVVGLIRGHNGTVVRLTVISTGKEASEARVVSLTRGHVQTPFGGLGDGKLLSPGTMAPNFKFTRLADGKQDELAGQRGKLVVFDAWASWCKPCLEHLAKLDALAAEHPEWKDRVEILAVSIDESREIAADCSKAHHWSKLSAAWTGPTVCDAYHIIGVPVIYIIARDGKIIADNSVQDISKLIQEQHLLDGGDKQPSEKKNP